MLEYFNWVIFILCVALAAGSIVLSTRLRNRFRSSLFSTLLYYLVFIFTFGFYGIWGQLVIKTYLLPYFSTELTQLLSDIALLLGLPFLVFAWFMLIQFSFQLSGRKNTNTFIFWFLFLNISALAGIGYIIVKGKSMLLTGNYYIVMNGIYTLVASFLILFSKKKDPPVHSLDRKIISSILIITMAIQSLFFILIPSSRFMGSVYVLLFFAGNAVLPSYLAYGPVRSGFASEPEINISLEDFCRKFEVSPREKDIIREICNGLSNQAISDKLFISLQTVKDHTHRIYLKTNVKSRAQLINLVNDNVGRKHA